jgi:5'-nucleotidase
VTQQSVGAGRPHTTTRGRVRSVAASALVGVLALTGVGLAGLPAQAAVSTDAKVLINEVYGGAHNGGAVFRNDFIELYNAGDAAVDLSTWSLQYASEKGTSWNAQALTGRIEPGKTFLVQAAAATGANAGDLPALPTADATITTNLSGTSGKVALVSSTTALAAATAAAQEPTVVDFVGYGSANDFAGTVAPAPSGSTSIARDADHTNTADNGADFTVGAPTPTNSAAGSPDPDPQPEPEPEPEPEQPPAPGTVTPIAEIQGEGAVTPLKGQTVTTEGVVTAHYPTGGLNGYVIQTAGTGGAIDLGTHKASDAVFIYSAATVGGVKIGDTVRVTGVADEYFGQTQITVAAGGAEVIAAQTPPTPATVVWPDTDEKRESLESMLLQPQGPMTVTNTYDTNGYGEVGLAVGTTPLRQPTDVAAYGTPEASAVAADNAARAVLLDDGATTNFLDRAGANAALTPPYVSLSEPVVVGGAVSFDKPVIVGYGFDAWRLQPTAPVIGDGTGKNDGVTFANPRTSAPAQVGGDVSVASFNVLNYFTTLGADTAGCEWYEPIRNGEKNSVAGGCDVRGAWDAQDLARQQSKIVSAINSLDASVVGLMEIENSARLGETADEATRTLVAALNAAAGSSKWAVVPSSAELPAASGQDVITNAIIYQPALATPVGASRALGTLSGSGQAFENAREPIGQTFAPVGGGEDFFFVVNHFKSKGSAPSSGPNVDNGQGAWNVARTEQAKALAAWVETAKGDVDSVVLVGDFNSYAQESPMLALYDAGYVDAEKDLGTGESSYSFDGLVGSLDHVLLNGPAAQRATGADIWNINSGESIALEYSRYKYHGSDFYAEGPYRSSDHDPVKVGLSATAEAPVSLTLLGINDFHGRIDANTVKFAGTIEQLRAQARGESVFVSSGDNIGASLFASSYFQDTPTLDVLNALELQASAVGNHEFDKGFSDLTGRVKSEADFPYLGANVYQRGTKTPVLPEYDTVEVDGLTVAFIGAVTGETASLVSPGGISAIDFGDPVEAVNRVAAKLTDGDPANGEADVIVALYHDGAGAGTPDGATLEEELAANGAFTDIVEKTSPAVGAIFTGHTHKQYAWSASIPGTDRTRPVVQTGSYGERIGKITLDIDADSGEILAHSEENVARTTTDDARLVADYPRVAEVKRIVDKALEDAKAVGNIKVGEVATDITTAFGGGSFVGGVWTGGARDDRASESALGNLVAEALRSSMAGLPNGAEIGVTNPGGLRNELYDTQAEYGGGAVPGLADGDISFSQALAVLPFNNTTTLVSLTGAQFRQLLEQQWQPATDAEGKPVSRPYLQLGLSENVTYTYDDTRAKGERITSVTIDGEPLDADATYRVGTLSFLADGGDNFTVFQEGANRLDTGNVDYQAWVDYLEAQTPVSASYAKHAVRVTGQTTAAPGTDAVFTVSNLNLTSLGTPETTSLEVRLGDAVLGTVPVSAGSANVTVPVPADAELGAVADVVLTSAAAGTQVTVPVTVGQPAAPGTSAPPTPVNPGGSIPGAGVQAGGTWATVVLSNGGRVEQGGQLQVTLTGLTPGQQVAATLFSDPIAVTGIPAADASGTVRFAVSIPAGFELGAHRLVITTAGADAIQVGVTVVRPGALAATGTEAPWGVALGGAFLLVAGGLAYALRRRRATTAV